MDEMFKIAQTLKDNQSAEIPDFRSDFDLKFKPGAIAPKDRLYLAVAPFEVRTEQEIANGVTYAVLQKNPVNLKHRFQQANEQFIAEMKSKGITVAQDQKDNNYCWYTHKNADQSLIAEYLPQTVNDELKAELALNAPSSGQTPEQACSEALMKAGIQVPASFTFNGKVQYVPLEGRTSKDQTGRYCGYLDGVIPAGWVFNHKTMKKSEAWVAKDIANKLSYKAQELNKVLATANKLNSVIAGELTHQQKAQELQEGTFYIRPC